MVVTLNFMHLGWSDARVLEPQLQPDLTEAQLSAQNHLSEQVSHFLRSPEPLPGVNWRRMLAAKSVDYNQDLVLKGRPLT